MSDSRADAGAAPASAERAPGTPTEAAANSVLVEVTRGTAVESLHRGAVAVVDPDGRVVLSAGAVDWPVLPRSAVKPLQALVLLETGAAEAFGLSDREVALACASHAGEPAHVDAVTRWLTRLELCEADLACGVQPPSGGEAARALIAEERAPDQRHNTCSGKHAGFLTVARQLDAPVAGYTEFGHPVQQRVLGVLEQMTGLDDLTAQPRGLDGCGIPTIALPLGNLALAMARLGNPDDQPERRQQACARVRRAMAAHPQMVAGSGRADTRILEALGAAALVKSGAEGVYAGTLPELGLGLALKVDDGAPRAAEVLLLRLLDRLKLLDGAAGAALADLARPTVWSRTGAAAGEIRTVAEIPGID